MKKSLLALFFGIISANLLAQSDDTLNFETAPSVISIDSINGIWQIGNPQKLIFDSAYSADNIIITDTINSYPVSTRSTFDIILPVPAFSAYYSLKFKHRFDTDPGKDGGYIQLYDCFSEQWQNIVFWGMSCDAPYGVNYMGSSPTTLLHDGEYGYSGTSIGWENVELYIPCMAVVHSAGPYEIRLRFVFTSDTIPSTKEGWMIDDLIFHDAGGFCSSIEENNLTSKFKIYPNPSSEIIQVESHQFEIYSLSVLDLNGKIVMNQTIRGNKKATLSISELSTGIYSVILNNEFAGTFIRE